MATTKKTPVSTKALPAAKRAEPAKAVKVAKKPARAKALPAKKTTPAKKRPKAAPIAPASSLPEGLKAGWDEGLSARERAFVLEFIVTRNATNACIKAGYSQNGAGPAACRLLKKVKVAAAIAAHESAMAKRLSMDADDVVREFIDLATADAQEISQTRRVCCRYCHGHGFAYQFTPAEFKIAEREHAVTQANFYKDTGKELPDLEGQGNWYDKRKAINPDCPECHGEGSEEVFIADSRSLTGKARKLYAGVEVTRDGIKVKTRDQDGALANVARALGVFKDKDEGGAEGDAPLDMLNTLFGEAMKRARSTAQEVHARRLAEGRDGN